jgi:Protein of unknown function (DUF2911)
MKMFKIFFISLLFSVFAVYAQDKPRLSLKASVSQTIGTDTEITIVYSRPRVKGRTIWGDIVPMGMYPPRKDGDKPYPWRAGANENTTFETSKDITVDGKDLPAGKYGLHMIAGEKEWVIIFSKTNDSWGSYSYDQANDFLRITVKPMEAAHEEWLSYGFDNLAGTSATAYLRWEKIKIPFEVAVK